MIAWKQLERGLLLEWGAYSAVAVGCAYLFTDGDPLGALFGVDSVRVVIRDFELWLLTVELEGQLNPPAHHGPGQLHHLVLYERPDSNVGNNAGVS